jgi:hypothetical protein
MYQDQVHILFHRKFVYDQQDFRQVLNLASCNMWVLLNAYATTFDSDDFNTDSKNIDFHRNTLISFGDERRGRTLELLSTPSAL